MVKEFNYSNHTKSFAFLFVFRVNKKQSFLYGWNVKIPLLQKSD